MAITVINGPMIAAGESLSNDLDLGTQAIGLTRITFPPEWTGRAVLTFQVSADGITYTDLYYQDGRIVTLVVVPSGTTSVERDIWTSGHVKFRSGTPDYPIIQTAARTFISTLE
jgi:hypothetical protein